MNPAIMLTALIACQFGPEFYHEGFHTHNGICHQAPIHVPTETWFFIKGDIVEETRVYVHVHYQNRYERVPVINGFVPNLSKAVFPNGDKVTTYDYTLRRPLSSVFVLPPKPKPSLKKSIFGMSMPSEVKDPEKRLVPNYRGNE